MSNKFQVGQVWMDGYDDRWIIDSTEFDPNDPSALNLYNYPIHGHLYNGPTNNVSWTKNGFYSHNSESRKHAIGVDKRDLIKLVQCEYTLSDKLTIPDYSRKTIEETSDDNTKIDDTHFNFCVGDIWRARNGELWVIDNVENDQSVYVVRGHRPSQLHTPSARECWTSEGYYYAVGVKSGNDPRDLITNVSEESICDKLGPKDDHESTCNNTRPTEFSFEVGQTWKSEDGDYWVITRVDLSDDRTTHPITGHLKNDPSYYLSWTKFGTYHMDNKYWHNYDLVEFVTAPDNKKFDINKPVRFIGTKAHVSVLKTTCNDIFQVFDDRGNQHFIDINGSIQGVPVVENYNITYLHAYIVVAPDNHLQIVHTLNDAKSIVDAASSDKHLWSIIEINQDYIVGDRGLIK